MAEPVKDFWYYADQAEREMQLSLGRDDRGQFIPGMTDEIKHRHLVRAEVYARLAASAPTK